MKKDRLVGSRWTEEDVAWFEKRGFKEAEDFSIGPLTNVNSTQISYKLSGSSGKFSGEVEAFKNEDDQYIVVISWEDEHGKGTGKTLKAALRKAKADFRAALRNAVSDANCMLKRIEK